jgi:hypothetical protein
VADLAFLIRIGKRRRLRVRAWRAKAFSTCGCIRSKKSSAKRIRLISIEKAEIVVTQKVLLKPLPERVCAHGLT